LLFSKSCTNNGVGALNRNQSPIDLEGINAEYMSNISYDVFDETKFDIWMPKSEYPTGLLIYYHGGGFTAGDKNVVYKKDKLGFPG
jgi:acetyl esterase/lipase